MAEASEVAETAEAAIVEAAEAAKSSKAAAETAEATEANAIPDAMMNSYQGDSFWVEPVVGSVVAGVAMVTRPSRRSTAAIFILI